MKHCYLLTLEITPLAVGEVYDTLPSHCTLVHRFWISLSPRELMAHVEPILEATGPVTYTIGKRIILTDTKAYELLDIEDLTSLHMQLYELLKDLGADYTAEEWVGTGYKAHISLRDGQALKESYKYTFNSVYLIEVNVPDLPHKRIVRAKQVL